MALLRQQSPEKEIESISVRFSDSTDETLASQKISEKFQTNHHILEIDNFLKELPKAISIVKQPFWDLHWYYLVKEMKNYSNIFFSGDGGDELFGGYTFRYKKFLESTTQNSQLTEKITAYLNCHERDWVPDQEQLFGKCIQFSWNEIYKIIEPYFNNSLSPLNQVFLADYNGKLSHNMIPLYQLIHNFFNMKNVTPLHDEELILYSSSIPDIQKYNVNSNLGKIILVNLLDKYKIKNLISKKKQGFSVNTSNLWNSYGKSIFHYYFDESRLVEDGILNPIWIKKHVSKKSLDVRYINKFLGILALEIWYRLFITKDMNSNEQLIF